jgi:hypothetical protein
MAVQQLGIVFWAMLAFIHEYHAYFKIETTFRHISLFSKRCVFIICMNRVRRNNICIEIIGQKLQNEIT